MPVSVKHSQLS
jgi:Domain of unknown function (DUF3471)